MKRHAVNRVMFAKCCTVAVRWMLAVPWLFAITSLYTAPSLFAEQGDELRLFHVPDKSEVADDQTVNKAEMESMLPVILETELRAWKRKTQQAFAVPVAVKTNPSIARVRSDTRTYRYNGFISTDSGRYYMINGQRLADFKLFELVSANDGGRSLILKSSGGRVFELSIGQSISGSAL